MVANATTATTGKHRIRASLIAVSFLASAWVASLVPWQAVAVKALPTLDLSQADPWFVDWRLSALKDDALLCKQALIAPYIDALPIADNAVRNGCGWINSVRMSRAGDIRASFDKITCEAAVALAFWLDHEVQPAAQEYLGQSIASVESLGSYTCRNIVGDPLRHAARSEHAIANAIDIAGFRMGDGRVLSVRSQWRTDSPESKFLRVIRDRACHYFHVVLSPDHNQAHRDHLHLDRGPARRCA